MILYKNLDLPLTASLSESEQSVICTLLYFDIFHYPLTMVELVKFSQCRGLNYQNIEQALSILESRKIVYKKDQYYSLWASDKDIERRKSGNLLAKRRMNTAKTFSKIIAWFPFVRGIMLSGSLSKDYMEEGSDIDYFVITAPRRAWLTRALLAVFKRIFLLNSHRNFCTNYFIDTDSLEIAERNIYTATETVTLIPVFGRDVWQQFMKANPWTKEYFPNECIPRTSFIRDGRSWVKSFSEFVLFDKLADNLNRYFMKLAVNRWKKRHGVRFTEEEFDIAFKSNENVSKNHPLFYQKKVLDEYNKKIKAFELENNLKLTA